MTDIDSYFLWAENQESDASPRQVLQSECLHCQCPLPVWPLPRNLQSHPRLRLRLNLLPSPQMQIPYHNSQNTET